MTAARPCASPPIDPAAHIFEKDVWSSGRWRSVDRRSARTWCSRAALPVRPAIRHFPEDVDPTYDIRAIAPDLVGGRWRNRRKTAARRSGGRRRYATASLEWIAETVQPLVFQIDAQSLAARQS